MLNTKKVLLSFAFVALLGTIVVGCNKTQQPAPTPQTGQPAPTATAQYVGNDTCKGCHSDKMDAVSKTKHFQAFKPLSDYPLTAPAGQITLFDPTSTDTPKSTTIDLTKVYGVMMNDYIIAQVPEGSGFKDKVYRVAALKKEGDKWTIQPAKGTDVNKDGKPDYTAESFSCGKCHAPGIENKSKDLGPSCESCHGPGGNHVTAADKKGTMKTSVDSCVACHKSDPVKDAQGNFVTQNHYGTRDYFASKHAQGGSVNCLTCHESHKANASGALLTADKPNDICAKCHAGKNYDVDKIMWKNPTDQNNHITRDHSFGAMKYEDLGDDPATKPVEIKNQTMIDLIKKGLPDLAK